MMPMLPLGNTWLTYIHTKLTAIYRLQQFCETAALIYVHLQRKDSLLFGQIAKKSTVKLLGE